MKPITREECREMLVTYDALKRAERATSELAPPEIAGPVGVVAAVATGSKGAPLIPENYPMKNTNTEIDFAMADIVNAFLKWPLPESVSSDTCCNRPGKGRCGTNLLTCPETVSMVQEVIRPVVEKLLKKHAASAAPANNVIGPK